MSRAVAYTAAGAMYSGRVAGYTIWVTGTDPVVPTAAVKMKLSSGCQVLHIPVESFCGLTLAPPTLMWYMACMAQSANPKGVIAPACPNKEASSEKRSSGNDTTSSALMNAYELGAGSKPKTRDPEVTFTAYSLNKEGKSGDVQLEGRKLFSSTNWLAVTENREALAAQFAKENG